MYTHFIHFNLMSFTFYLDLAVFMKKIKKNLRGGSFLLLKFYLIRIKAGYYLTILEVWYLHFSM